MRPATHLANQSLLLDLPAELAQCLLELLRIPDDYLQAVITSLNYWIARRTVVPGRVIQKHTLVA
jgi:hypothetical protein